MEGQVDKKEMKLKFYYDGILELIKSYEGKNLIGKLVRNKQGLREAYLRRAEEYLLKMIDIDEKSQYVADARRKLYDDLKRS